jgi:hypothetical protein
MAGLLRSTLELAWAGRPGRLVRRVLHPADGVLALTTVAAIEASIAAYVYFASRHLTLAYGDAMSHLLIARRVIEASTPGLGQLGGVWLPLPHLLMIPTVWINSWYYSGFSGSIVSMVSYVLTTRYLYKTVVSLTSRQGDDGHELGGNRVAGVLAATLFAANPNVLYLQSTAMTETLLMVCLAAAVYHLTLWCRTGSYRQLALTALAFFLATITRYEGWVVCIAALPVVGWVAWHRHRESEDARGGHVYATWRTASNGNSGVAYPISGLALSATSAGSPGSTTQFLEIVSPQSSRARRWGSSVRTRFSTLGGGVAGPESGYRRTEADVVYFAFIALMGIAGWVAWNLVIFHNAFYFQDGQFAKPSLWVATGEKAVGHWSVAIMTYLYAMVDNMGILALVLGVVGMVCYFVRRRLEPGSLSPLVLLPLLPFYVYSLYYGQRPLHVMQIDGNLYNVRFGVLMVLPLALFFAYLVEAVAAGARRIGRAAVVCAYVCLAAVVCASIGTLAAGGTDTLKEAVASETASSVQAAAWLRTHYDGGLVLMESFGNDTVTFESHIPVGSIIFEGSYQQWAPALADPVGRHIRWIYMRRTAGSPDIVYSDLHKSTWIRDDYLLAYSNSGCLIYRLDVSRAQLSGTATGRRAQPRVVLLASGDRSA